MDATMRRDRPLSARAVQGRDPRALQHPFAARKAVPHLAGAPDASRINSDHLTVACPGWRCSARACRTGSPASTPVGLMAVIVCLAINWFGDSLDGTLARVRHHQRPRYGFYVDHIVDAFGMRSCSAACRCRVTCLRYVGARAARRVFHAVDRGLPGDLFAGHVQDHATSRSDRPSCASCSRLATSRCWCIRRRRFFGRDFQLFDVGGVVAIAGLFITFVISAARNIKTLYRAEPIPRDDRR